MGGWIDWWIVDRWINCDFFFGFCFLFSLYYSQHAGVGVVEGHDDARRLVDLDGVEGLAEVARVPDAELALRLAREAEEGSED